MAGENEISPLSQADLNELDIIGDKVIAENRAQSLIKDLDTDHLGRMLAVPSSILGNRPLDASQNPEIKYRSIGYSLPATSNEDNDMFFIIFENGRRVLVGPGKGDVDRNLRNYMKTFAPNDTQYEFDGDTDVAGVIKGLRDMGRLKADSGESSNRGIDFHAMQVNSINAAKDRKARLTGSSTPPQT
ncbi:MAG TPA: hypothetical protein VND99_05475 [Candidatus Acidoferrales bacterium]|nr:hypothetical protein [Candidatus Acidoferrales bacterium]